MNPHAETVLILASGRDVAAERVAADLAVRGVPVVRLDAAQFPGHVAMSATIGPGDRWRGRIDMVDSRRQVLDLASVGAVYYRHPEQFVLDTRMSGPERAFAFREARRGLGGVIQALAHCMWVNNPLAAARAEYKPVQLAAAAEIGLAVPQTLITSDPLAAHKWAKSLGRPLIYKPLGGIWHGDEDQVRVLYTTPISDPEELLDEAISRTAHLFQEQIPKAFEVRAVVVGNRVFAIKIAAGSEAAKTDWRSDYDSLIYAEPKLPDELSAKLVALHRQLGLTYGAVDLICDTSNHWVFLETNPVGEWGWLTEQTGAPIAAALADELTGVPT